jgi:hypothetical protein
MLLFSHLSTLQNKTCKASGIIPYTIINNTCYVLVARQTRRHKNLFNFIGGKRNNSFESALNIAKREFIEETTTINNTNVLPIKMFNQFLSYTPKKMLYCNRINYALFPFRLFLTKEEQDYITHPSHKFNEVNSLHWINLSYFYNSNYRRSCFHKWTSDILEKTDISFIMI